MNTLSKNWLTERHIDFEYKKFVLLAYFQDIKKCFNAVRLYPWLADLIGHYRNLISIRRNKKNLENNFPQQLSGINLATKEITYDGLIKNDDLMMELEAIIEFAMPQFEKHLEEGKTIYDLIEEKMSIQPIGIIPINQECGYMLLKSGHLADTYIYEFQISFFETSTERYKAIHTHFVKSVKYTISHTFPSIKSDLLHENRLLPNPAVYSIECEMTLPMEETFLPIAKRMLVKHLSEIEKKD